MAKKKHDKRTTVDPKVGVGVSMPTSLRDLIVEVAGKLDANKSDVVVEILEPGLMRKAKRLGLR